jgi:hypothetical protein
MNFQGRALYNFLKITHQEDPSTPVEDWQLMDYRALSEKELFSLLPTSLSSEAFFLYAESCDSPEQLVECLWLDESDLIGQEKTYLAVFELWRRHFPNKQSLSIFCDELDHQIALFDAGKELDEEIIHPLLNDLEDTLENNTEDGESPQEVFALISAYAAHDIAGFLFDYILELIEKHSEAIATSFVEAFEDYVPEKKWFTLLRAYLLSASQVQIWSHLLHGILEEEEENPSTSFLKEVFYFLQGQEDPALFKKCSNLLLPLLSQEEKEELFQAIES